MTTTEAYAQYEFEVALFEQWGTTNVINFEEWLNIKGITIKEDNNMTTAEARKVLIRYNAWRRYDGPVEQTPLQPEPKEIGEAIDVAIEVLPKEEAEEASLDEAARRYAEDIWLYGASWQEAEKQKETSHIPETCKENADSFTEDERIRQWLYNLVDEGAYLCERPFATESILSYLEKQKEQKPVKCIDFNNEFENQVSHLLASVLNGEWEYDEGFVKHSAQSLLGYAKNEMKPDEWDKREKLFTKALQAANARIGQLFEENQKLKEQKPEWSEEDRIMLNDIIRCLPSKSSAEFNQKRVNWLKSLPERFNLQPKQKWSEEDEKTINDACCWIAEYAGYLMDKNYGKASMLMGLTDKLKSLRPSWKPSEEQMNALYDILYPADTVNRLVIESLYNDLKKLM